MNRFVQKDLWLAYLALLAIAAAPPIAHAVQVPAPRAETPLVIAKQGYFFVAGQYTEAKNGPIMTGQMFVQYQIPARKKHRYPIVMWHGGGQTGTNFLGTPDGRMGWAEYFLRAGYAVYVVDQPGRGRSGYYTEVYGPTRRPNAKAMSERFGAPELVNLYPQAKLHTQFPGKGVAGDSDFDQFFASQVEDMQNLTTLEELNRNAGVALLEKIGPAILLTHSQSGPFGWEVGDSRPDLVKAIVAIEPNGPPFHENLLIGAPDWFKQGPLTRPWGITRIPLTFDPQASDPKDLAMTQEANADGPDLLRCWLPAAPARQLVNLKRIPILMVTSEASYHAPYDHCTSKFLDAAGVKHTFTRLPDAGIHGNAHMMMLEKNNLQIAALLRQWIDKTVH